MFHFVFQIRFFHFFTSFHFTSSSFRTLDVYLLASSANRPTKNRRSHKLWAEIYVSIYVRPFILLLFLFCFWSFFDQKIFVFQFHVFRFNSTFFTFHGLFTRFFFVLTGAFHFHISFSCFSLFFCSIIPMIARGPSGKASFGASFYRLGLWKMNETRSESMIIAEPRATNVNASAEKFRVGITKLLKTFKTQKQPASAATHP